METVAGRGKWLSSISLQISSRYTFKAGRGGWVWISKPNRCRFSKLSRYSVWFCSTRYCGGIRESLSRFMGYFLTSLGAWHVHQEVRSSESELCALSRGARVPVEEQGVRAVWTFAMWSALRKAEGRVEVFMSRTWARFSFFGLGAGLPGQVWLGAVADTGARHTAPVLTEMLA